MTDSNRSPLIESVNETLKGQLDQVAHSHWGHPLEWVKLMWDRGSIGRGAVTRRSVPIDPDPVAIVVRHAVEARAGAMKRIK